MHLIVWEFRARAGREEEFERVYGREGERARLFSRGEGYLGTEILCDVDERGRYVTIDRWTSRADFAAFRHRWASGYRELDRRCEALREQETALGSFAYPEPR